MLLIVLLAISSGQLASQQTRAQVESVHQTEMSLYPNPAQDYFSIKTSADISRISIHNIIGKEILSLKANSDHRYAIDGLQRGLYVVRIFGKNDELVKALRLSKS